MEHSYVKSAMQCGCVELSKLMEHSYVKSAMQCGCVGEAILTLMVKSRVVRAGSEADEEPNSEQNLYLVLMARDDSKQVAPAAESVKPLSLHRESYQEAVRRQAPVRLALEKLISPGGWTRNE